MEASASAASIGERILALVRNALDRNAIAADVRPWSRLADVGLSSVEMVALMLRLEAEFGLALPQSEITPENFQSVETIERLVVQHVRGGSG
jgi:acyl carrier protein